MVNLAASAPPVIAKAGNPPSTSVEVTVVTAVAFSATLRLAVAPPPSLVMAGVSLTGVTAALRATVLLLAVPSLTVKLTLRVRLLGLSLVFRYFTARSAA